MQWQTKFCPQTLSEFGNLELLTRWSRYLEQKDVPNLLITANGVYGKTTLLQIIKKLWEEKKKETEEEEELVFMLTILTGAKIKYTKERIDSFCTQQSHKKSKII